MSRHSARKVKLTSKFEEFSTSRMRESAHKSHKISNSLSTSISTPTPTPTPAPIVTSTPAPSLAPTLTLASTPVHTKTSTSTRTSTSNRTSISASTPVPAPTPTPVQTPYSGSSTPLPKLTAKGKIRGRPRKIWQDIAKPLPSTREELTRLREENASLKASLKEKNDEYEELKRNSTYTGQTVPKSDYDDLKEKYQRDMSHAKRHEWCVVCLSPSRYPCCWNTTYCSQKCQVEDWYKRHGKSCERFKKML